MRHNDRLLGATTLAVLLAGTGLLARKGVAGTWKKMTHRPPPKEQGNEEVDIREAIAWAIASGVAVGLARLLVRRTLGYRGSPLD